MVKLNETECAKWQLVERLYEGTSGTGLEQAPRNSLAAGFYNLIKYTRIHRRSCARACKSLQVHVASCSQQRMSESAYKGIVSESARVLLPYNWFIHTTQGVVPRIHKVYSNSGY